ncbi:MAG: hypothetical protein ABJD11_12430 [Gemmatimonadota bacterium]
MLIKSVAAAGVFIALAGTSRLIGHRGLGVAPAGSMAPRVVAIKAHDYAYEIPDTIAAGVTTLQMANEGKELHQAQLVRLTDGKRATDLLETLKAQGPLPGWVKFVGGPNAVGPGGIGNATTTLLPGHYAIVCFIPSPGGPPHVMKGMIREFDVTGPAAPASDRLPAADISMKTIDYDFTLSKPFTAGHHTILVENGAAQSHEVVLVRLQPGRSAQDFDHWAEGTMEGPPPVTSSTGITAMENGDGVTFDVDLTPGEYVLICFAPDIKDGKSHASHGMIKQLTVK